MWDLYEKEEVRKSGKKSEDHYTIYDGIMGRWIRTDFFNLPLMGLCAVYDSSFSSHPEVTFG